ncbi:MAG: NAD/NADP octopine/nopaline dehydrogenase family protein [Pseudomonadota bacterium]|nr:NAD/NADP octopine/nopaline dehydrogenase family protein [Pseudomonadota bacterium]
MDIAVIGGGNGSFAAAAEFSEQAHDVRWWRRDKEGHEAVSRAGGLTVKDRNGDRQVTINTITNDLGEAVRGAQLIVIPLPATTHESLAPQLAQVLEPGQVVFLPPGTFGSFLFAKALYEVRPEVDVSFAETGTLPYLVRKHGPTEIVVSGYATRLPTGVFPARNADHAFGVLEDAYPSVERIEDALSGALMNAGPIIHPPLIIMNAAPLEHFETWDIHNEGTQPSTRHVTDRLDQERIAIRKALGYKAPHFPLRDHYQDDGDEWMYGRKAHDELTDSGDWREDIDLQTHRYMLEDTALGLSLFTSVGRWAGKPMPIGEALLAMGSAITGEDLYALGRSLENLGLDKLSTADMQTLLHDGMVTLK